MGHFIHGRNIRLINRTSVEDIVRGQIEEGITKSYEQVILKLDELADKS